MGGGPPALVRSYERWTRVCERLREITRVCECWTDCLKQDLQDFLGFSGWRGSRRHWCARTSAGREFASVYERSREFASVGADCLKQDLQDFLGFSGWGEARRQVARTSWTRVCERWTRVCECLRVLADCLKQDLQDLLGFSGWGEARRHWCARTSVGREFASVYERSSLRVFTCVGRIVWSRICRIYWDFQDGGGPADAGGLVRALDESLRAFTRDHERLRVFTCVGWIVWSRICRIYWDFQDGGGPADAGGL